MHVMMLLRLTLLVNKDNSFVMASLIHKIIKILASQLRLGLVTGSRSFCQPGNRSQRAASTHLDTIRTRKGFESVF